MINKEKTGFAIILIFSLIFMAGCKDNGTNPTNNNSNNNAPPANEIWMQNATFVPSTLEITKGTTITWVNKDSFNHTASSGTPDNPTTLFESGSMGQNDTFSFTFDSVGVFKYYCKIHPKLMQGQVTVK